MGKKYFLYIILLFLSQSSIEAQKLPYSFPSEKNASQFMINHWTVEEGLPSQGLRNFIQSKSGFIWITSYDGLIKFDGFEFSIFNAKNTEVFKENICSHITEDKEDRLWFLSRHRLIYYENNSFIEFKIDSGYGTISGPLFVDSHNKLWLTSDVHGVFYIKNDQAYKLDDKVLNGKEVVSFAEDKSGNIFIGTNDNRLFKIDGDLKTKLLLDRSDNYKSAIQLLHFFDNKLYWINDDRQLLMLSDSKVFPETMLGKTRYFSFKMDHFGNRWFSTEKGLYKQDFKSKKVEQILQNTNDFSLNIVDETLIDYEGNLWLRLYRQGIIKMRYGRFSSINTQNGLKGKLANAICESKTGTLFIGFDNGAINKIVNNKVFDFLSPKKTKKSRVRHINEDSFGNLWISTYKGILKISPKGDEYWINSKNGLLTDIVRLTFEDSDKNIWVGTNSDGIFLIKRDKSIQSFPKLSILKECKILSIKQNSEGHILVGTAGNGLFEISNGEILKNYTNENLLNNNVVFDTHLDSDNVLWVITNGGGLNRIEKNKSTFYSQKNGLDNDSPFDLVEDDFGYFWMPSSNGVMKLSKKQLNDFATGKILHYDCEVLDKYDGIKSRGFTPSGHSVKDMNGDLWFPSFDGVEIIHPADTMSNLLPPPVHINVFAVDNEIQNLSKPITLKPGKKRFKINFTAICLQAPEKVRFRYKLIGFDQEWIETNSQIREVNYTSLNYGNYEFKVLASNNDGLWNEEGASVKFEIEPFYYQRVWFIIMVILIFLSIIYFIYKLRIKQIIRNEEKLKKTVLERTSQITLQKHEIETQRDEITLINETLITQKEELEDHRNHLEELVHKRTAELEKAKNQAEESDRLKTAFLNNMSHEIRTPMNGIIGFTQFLGLPDIEEKQKENYVDIITKSTNQLLNIVDEIIYISKIDAGVEKLKRKDININIILTEIYNLYFAEAEKKQLSFKLIKEPEDKIAIIHTDLSKLNKVICTLIDNAFKFTKKGNIEFGYHLIDDFIKFFVKDTGIGIDPEMHDKIFQQFRQVEETTSTREYGGLGLGLAISKAYVEIMGGSIWLESEMDSGTTFYFTIPKEA